MGSIGRNEPCPCGSGRKYKKCHGAPVNTVDPLASLAGDAPGLFGPRAGYLISLLDSFANAAQPRSYRIMPLAESATVHGLAERNQIYWQEILFRAHFGASAGLMRLREWLHGSERALADGNVLMLAAGIRGFLEAARRYLAGVRGRGAHARRLACRRPPRDQRAAWRSRWRWRLSSRAC